MCDQNKKNSYLCVFCGIFIRTSLAHLARHEKLHAEKVPRVKCLASGCSKTFHNKDNYWLHWKRTHGDTVMPDKIVYVDETPKSRKNKYKYEYKSKDNEWPIDFFILNKMNLVQTQGLNLRNIVSFCLIREPNFGQITFE